MDSRDLNFEARVRLRRNASPETIIAEMVAAGLDEEGSRQAIERVLVMRRERKQNGVAILIGGGVVALTGFLIMGILGLVLIVVGLSLVGKGGSDAFSF